MKAKFLPPPGRPDYMGQVIPETPASPEEKKKILAGASFFFGVLAGIFLVSLGMPKPKR